MKHLTFSFLLAALCLSAGCGKLSMPDLTSNASDPIPTATPITVQAAQKQIQPLLDRFLHRGVLVSMELLPAQTKLYCKRDGEAEPVLAGITEVPTWVFAILPNVQVNGQPEWLYLFVNGLNGDANGRILTGELQGMSWRELYKKDDKADNYVLWLAENLGVPSDSAWRGAVAEWKPEEARGNHAWIRRIDSQTELQALYAGENAVPVDWSKKTLLLVAGMEMYMNDPFDLTFSADGSTGRRTVSVCRIDSMATALRFWTRAVLVDKLPADTAITVETSFL